MDSETIPVKTGTGWYPAKQRVSNHRSDHSCKTRRATAVAVETRQSLTASSSSPPLSFPPSFSPSPSALSFSHSSSLARRSLRDLLATDRRIA